jgi:hypothetical protein
MAQLLNGSIWEWSGPAFVVDIILMDFDVQAFLGDLFFIIADHKNHKKSAFNFLTNK